MLDVVGSVVVHAVEVVGAFDKSLLLLGEGRKTVAKLLAHRLGVLTKVDGISEPADGELNFAVGSLDVLGVAGIVREGSVTIQGDADFTTIGLLEVIAVGFDGASMGNKKVVTNNPGLGAAVAFGALRAIRGATWGELADTVPENGRAPGFVEGNPVLHLGKALKADTGIVLEVKGELLTVEKTTIALLELIRNVPVKQSDEGSDASGEEVVTELAVVVKTGLVDGVVAATLGDDARPAQREAVCLRAAFLEKGNILRGAVVGVTRGHTGAAVSDLAGNGSECIPNGWATAILVDGALNLVTAANC